MSYDEGLGGLGGGLGGYTSLALRDPAAAAALRKQQMGLAMATSWKPEGPVLSPWQGVDSLVKGLMGAYLYNQGDSEAKDAGAKQTAEANDFKNTMSGLLMGGQPQPPTPQASGMGAALSGQPTGGAPLAQGDMPAQPINSAIHQLESGGRMQPGIVGDGGKAAGPMQVHQAALDDVNRAQGTNYTMADLVQKPEIGKAIGDAYTGILQQRYPGRPDLVLAAYNGGMGNVDRGTIPPAAQAYAQRGLQAMGGTQYAGPGVPQDQAPQAPQAPDPEAMMARAAQIRQAALQASQHNNPGIRSQAAYMEHYADSLERQAQSLQARTERRNDRQDAYTQRQQDAADRRAEAAANRVPQTITMQDPDGTGVGIYERTPDGVGKRIGNAPKQPGESGAFGGTGMDAQANNKLLSLGPKIADGTATADEKAQYALAYQHIQNGKMQWVPDPSDPTGQKQQMVQVPGAVPPNFPTPDGKPGGAPAAAGAPTKTASAPEADRQAAGYYLRMQQASKDINGLEQKGVHTGNTGAATLGALPGGNYFQSNDYQVYRQQAQDWVRAKLRKESGAAIGDKEMADEIKTYFPQPGDGADVIKAKQRSRQIAEAGMQAQAGKSVVEAPAMPQAPAGMPAPPPGFRIVQ